MDEEDLLQRARHGDRDAFAVLVTRFQDRLYTMAFRLLGNSADAADVVQETFLRAYTRMDELRGPTLGAWLYRVAINCSHDVQRRAARRPTDNIDDTQGKIVELPSADLDPEASAIARERTTVIAAALAALVDDFRVAVVLRDVNDLAYDDIALILQVPLGTVKSRVSRGRSLLATALRSSPVIMEASEGTA